MMMNWCLQCSGFVFVVIVHLAHTADPLPSEYPEEGQNELVFTIREAPGDAEADQDSVNRSDYTQQWLQNLEKGLQDLTRRLEGLESRFEALEAMKDETARALSSGEFDNLVDFDVATGKRVFVYDWKIPMETLENYTLGEKLYSERFYIALNGYRMFMFMYPTGDASRPSVFLSYVNVYAGIARGVYDNYLLWPFVHKFHLILLDQTEDGDPVNIEYAADPRTTCKDDGEIGEIFKKPTAPFGGGCGSSAFVQRSELFTRNYIKDGHITLRLKVFLD
ncbi:unnamed protein product [Darwinula stevensoni]|uniref:MATH domain-containing protein n=1 Tax=Darwinula stevensoni TaxID=69355 RepID=A0A7R8X4V1_9CRUS|nr:unnamed protein product [Darwinula stevensoni]CAG0880116.1 unnamed protein product [Darwinula stevensoni]